MKFTLSWLKTHLDTEADVSTIAKALNEIGLEVEAIEDPAKDLQGFVVAEIVSAEQHPNADRLRVCMVNAGGAPLQVVCGAQNARAGLKTVLGVPGLTVPANGMVLKLSAIRGVESRGMLCSAEELNIQAESDGIVELPKQTPVGMPAAQALGRTDPVIEIAVTPNRGDALGIRGIARDLAAKGLGHLKPLPAPQIKTGDIKAPNLVIEAPEVTRGFALCRINGVKNGPSPAWLADRLTSIGLRPINCLVDVTNLFTHDRNRPLHVFDANKVHGDLVVRRARDAETLLALDGRTYTLDQTMAVIADDRGPESLAGIMGGEASGCDEHTTDVLVECALWEPLNIAQTGRKLGIHSDARHRFERSVDPASLREGLEQAIAMIQDLCGGIASPLTIVGQRQNPPALIDFPHQEIKRLTGIEMERAEAESILAALGFQTKPTPEGWRVTPPSWREDVEGKADLVEEVVRIAGLDRLPKTPLPKTTHISQSQLTRDQIRRTQVRRSLAARGALEAITWSFIPQQDAKMFGGGQPELALINPIAADLANMRPSLIPSLSRTLQKNADRGQTEAVLFEVGQIFLGTKPNDQVTAATMVRRGTSGVRGAGRHWLGHASKVTAFDAKADALAIVHAAGFPAERVEIVQGGPSWAHPGQSGTLKIGRDVIGAFGLLHPLVAESLGLDAETVAAEVILEKLPLSKPKPTKAKPALLLSALQPVHRDFAFLAPKTLKASELMKAVTGADKKLVTNVDIFDVYAGQGVPEGFISVALRVTLQPLNATLSEAEIDTVSKAIVAAAKSVGAELRQ